VDQINDADVEASTRRWIDSVVIGLGFCPFAAAVVSAPGGLEISVVHGDNRSRLEQLLATMVRMQSSTAPETALLVMPSGLEAFSDFLDLMELADGVVEVHEFSGVFQLASFHPDYCFADTDPADPSNYTNRSPYPTMHILRESSVTEGLDGFDHPESIPERNMVKTRKLGPDTMHQLWEGCFGEPD